MLRRIGVGYLGSNKIETTTSTNQEIIPNSPASWTIPYNLYKMEVLNMDDCHIIINGQTELFRLAGQGFKMNEIDNPITSFVIVEEGIRYMWNGNY